jgi:large subunit ribosomal protein L21e
MASHKTSKTKGRFPLTKMFQEFKEGDRVAVSIELSVPFYYVKKLQGRTGKVLSARGKSYYIEINDLNKPKRYLLPSVHLKKIGGAVSHDSK